MQFRRSIAPGVPQILYIMTILYASLVDQIFCGRYVNEHMLIHQDTSGHKMALSLADISVWCYLCDSYIHNHVS